MGGSLALLFLASLKWERTPGIMWGKIHSTDSPELKKNGFIGTLH